MLVTASRTLEQFLFAHRIRFSSQRQFDGKTHWFYPVTPDVLRVVQEYMTLYEEVDAHENTDRVL